MPHPQRIFALGLLCLLPLAAGAGQRLPPEALAPAPAYDSGSGVPAPAGFFRTKNTAIAFRNTEEIMPTRRIPTSATPSRLKAPTAAYDVHYTFDGGSRSLLDFVRRNDTAALVILKDDRIVFEGYYQGADPTDLFTSFSSGKSFVSTLVGLAVADGHVKSIHDPIRLYLPELAGSAYESATIKQVLQMASGTSYSEDYDDPASDIDAFASLVGRNQGGLYDFARSFTAKRKPGTEFYYATTDTEILGALVARTTGKSLSAYMSERLWKPLGAESAGRWTLDQPGGAGREVAGGALQLRARDYARFGALFAHGGAWNGAQIVPAAWVAEATRPQDPYVDYGHVEPGTQIGYGYQWWCVPGPEHRYSAEGIHGQFVFVDPGAKVVVVAMSAWPEAWDDAKAAEAFTFFAAVADSLR
jgi:CubicO group peptidase (beta-lactamase class C family)